MQKNKKSRRKDLSIDDSGPAVWAEPSSDILGDGLGGALRKLEEKLPTLPEDPPQEAGHGEDDVAMGNGREHLLLKPLRPQETKGRCQRGLAVKPNRL